MKLWIEIFAIVFFAILMALVGMGVIAKRGLRRDGKKQERT